MSMFNVFLILCKGWPLRVREIIFSASLPILQMKKLRFRRSNSLVQSQWQIKDSSQDSSPAFGTVLLSWQCWLYPASSWPSGVPRMYPGVADH